MKQYLIQETEIGSISAAATSANIYYALASFTGALTAMIWVSAAFTETLPAEGVALSHVGAPILLIFTIAFLIQGILATRRGNAVWRTIREKSAGGG